MGAADDEDKGMRRLEKHEWPLGSKKLYDEVWDTDTG
jgi:hypothetical protein